MPGARVVLTSRTHYFRSDREARQVVEDRAGPVDNPLLAAIEDRGGVLAVRLRELTDDQIRLFISRRLGAASAERIWTEMGRRYNLQDLARRAVLLDMMLTTMPTLLERAAAIDVSDIYEAYTALWIKREDWRSNLTREGKAALMQRVAWRMIEEWLARPDRSRSIGQVGMTVPELLEVVAPVPDAWLKSSVGGARDREERIDYDLRACSFLLRDAEGRYTFSHRSFLEYFCAVHLARTLGDDASPLRHHRLATYSTSVRWEWPSPEIIDFLLALLRHDPGRRRELLRWTLAEQGSGGCGLTLYWEAARDRIPAGSLGHNLRDAVAYALDLAELDLRGADLEGAALAAADLERTGLRESRWHLAACRIDHVHDAAFGASNDELLVASGDNVVSRWQWQAMTRGDRLVLRSGYVFDAEIDPAHDLYAFTTWDDRIHVHACHSGRELWVGAGEGAGSGKIALSSDGAFVAGAAWTGWVRVWECTAAMGHEVAAWNLGGRANCLTFHPRSRTLLVGGDGVQVLRLDDRSTAALAGAGTSVTAVTVHPTEEIAAVAPWQNTAVALIDLRSYEVIQRIDAGVWDTYALRISPSGEWLAVGGQNGVALVRLATGEVTPLLANGSFGVKRLRFSPDGALLVSAGLDGVARVWALPELRSPAAVDLGIQCFGAEMIGALGFEGPALRLKADWEEWWTGPALRERFRRCGAVVEESEAPRGCWDGAEHTAWLTGLRWWNRHEAVRARLGAAADGRSFEDRDLFAGAAVGRCW